MLRLFYSAVAAARQTFGPEAPKPRDLQGEIYAAIRAGNFEEYTELKAEGASLNWIDTHGRNALYVAAEGGNIKIIEDLIDGLGFRVNDVNPVLKTTALDGAKILGEQEAVAYLRSRGAMEGAVLATLAAAATPRAA